MCDKEYSNWLQSYVTPSVVTNYISRCQRVENNLHIDLDDEFVKDFGKSLLEKLTYSIDDQIHNRPLRCNIFFNSNSDLKAGMRSLKTAVNNYFEFCRKRGISGIEKKTKMEEASKTICATILDKDSYQKFFNDFKINEERFLEWGISTTIFPSTDKVASEWDNLKKRIFTNQTVYIRKYGRNDHATQIYKGFYATLLNNTSVEQDPNNNTAPQKLIERMTGYKRNSDIYHYQVSHIWGCTKNIFMFEAPWNICYVPKIMDPFTGHEAKGILSVEYQRIFRAKAYELYRSFIEDYNQIIKKLDIENKLKLYISSLEEKKITEKEVVQFQKDASKELLPIVLS